MYLHEGVVVKIKLMVISLVAVLGLQGAQNKQNEQELGRPGLLQRTQELCDTTKKLANRAQGVNQQISNGTIEPKESKLFDRQLSNKERIKAQDLELDDLLDQAKKMNSDAKALNVKLQNQNNKNNDSGLIRTKELNTAKRIETEELCQAHIVTLKKRLPEANSKDIEVEAKSFNKSKPGYFSVSAFKNFITNRWVITASVLAALFICYKITR
jgi:hypothetical protein